jgi:hypothetical protein
MNLKELREQLDITIDENDLSADDLLQIEVRLVIQPSYPLEVSTLPYAGVLFDGKKNIFYLGGGYSAGTGYASAQAVKLVNEGYVDEDLCPE